MNILCRLLTTGLFWLATASLAQESSETPEQNIADRLSQIDSEVASLSTLREILNDDYSGLQAEVLNLRLDARAIRLLRHIDETADAISGLPTDAPQAGLLRESVDRNFDSINLAIFARLDVLRAKVGELTNALDDLTGVDRIVASARVDLIDTLLERYLQAMVRHLGVRENLGLSNEELLPRIQQELSLRAETMTGLETLASGMLRNFRSRSAGPDGKANLEFLINYTQDRRTRYLEALRTVIGMMNTIGMDASDYQSTLVAEEGVSFNVFNRSVLAQLVDEWTDALGTFLKLRGPDLAFKALLFVAIIVLFYFLARLVRWLLRGLLGRSRANLSILLKDTLVSIIGGSVMVLGILIALAQVGLSVGPMLAGLGIAGFIIGFALQDTLSNFASGAMILAYRPFDVDDFVEVTGASGVVKKMNLVSTTINTFDNQVLVVPNSKIWGDVIKNVTHQQTRRVDLEFGISYEDDIEKAERILAEVAAAHELVLEQPETNIRVHRLDESAVVLILRPWVKTQDYWTVFWDLTRAVKLRFDAEGITIPFPQRTVHLGKAADFKAVE